MNKVTKNRVIKIIIFIVAVFFMLPLDVSAIGISPSEIIVKGLSNNNKVEKSVYFTIAPKDEDQYIRATTVGDGKDYLVLKEDIFIVKANEHKYKYYFYIYPKTAANGWHTAGISFFPTSRNARDGTGSGMSIAIGSQATIKFEVTDKQIRNLQFVNFEITPTEENVPFSYIVALKNLGNIDDGIDKIDLQLTDITDSSHIYKETIEKKDIPRVKANNDGRLDIRSKLTIPRGQYKAEIVITADNKELYKKTINVEIYPTGTLNQSAKIEYFKTDKLEFEKNELVIFRSKIKNTGKIQIKPVLYVELKKGDVTVDLLRSNEKTLYVNDSSEFDISHRFTEAGIYKAKGYFEYGIKKSESEELSLTVGGKELAKDKAAAEKTKDGQDNSGYIVIGAVIIGLLILVIIILLIYVTRKRKNIVNKPIVKADIQSINSSSVGNVEEDGITNEQSGEYIKINETKVNGDSTDEFSQSNPSENENSTDNFK